ncbi:MAG: glycosyltransferase family 4 protein [Campylobacterales bacterium]|nr:glycosyltransferase family 4 protein [Campylobacterales bacterium]
MQKKILELCLSPDLGGLELCAADYFKYFQTKTEAYLCVAPDKKLDAFIEDTHKFTFRRSKFFPLFPARKLARFIDENEIDFIHFHWTRDIATAVLAKVLSKRKPQLMQSRHMTMTRFKSDFYHKWLYKNIDIMHAVTQQVQEQLVRFTPDEVRPKVEMVYLGVDEPNINIDKVASLKEKYNLQESFIVGMIGRIEEGKGQYLLLDALAKLKGFDIKVLIVGAAMSEEYIEELYKKVKKLGIEERVVFTGFTKDVHEHLQLCDLSVLATPKETFGLVIIESMANGVPVIATNRGGPLEIIDDGIDGLLFNRTSEELAEKIESVYKERTLKESLAKAAKEKVASKFNKTTQMQKMYEVISES